MLGLLKQSFLGQFFLAYVFVMAAVITDILQLLTLPLAWIGFRNQQRFLVGKLTHLHWILIPAIARWWADVDITIHARPDDMVKFGKEKAILIMNHKYQMDWVVSWILAFYYDVLQNVKAIVKSSLVYVPVVGWTMWLNECIFVKRNAKTDGAILDKNFKNFSTFMYNYWLLLFCEGTRFTPEKHKLSNEFAVKHGLKPLKHHLVPRTKGFVLAQNGLRENVPAVYDATLYCPGDKPPPLSDFAAGKYIKVDILIRRIPIDEVPTDEHKCADFLHGLYQEKDELLEFRSKNGVFPTQGEHPAYQDFVEEKIEIGNSALIIAILWIIVLVPPLLNFFAAVIFSGTLMQSILSSSILIIVSLTLRVMLKSGSPTSTYGEKVNK